MLSPKFLGLETNRIHLKKNTEQHYWNTTDQKMEKKAKMSQDIFKHLQKPKGWERPPNPNSFKYLGTIWWVMRTYWDQTSILWSLPVCLDLPDEQTLHWRPRPLKFISPSTSDCRTVTLGWGFERRWQVPGSSEGFYDGPRADAGGGSISQHCARLLRIFRAPWGVWRRRR